MHHSGGNLVEESLLQPEMVGREREFEHLLKRLDDVLDGRGSTLLISGEAGIGKTRLVEELKTVAQSRGFHILSGHSMYESLTPYIPFLEALKSGDLEYLFAEEAPRVEGIYLVTKTGLLIKEVVRQETELNPDIFASMLKTVSDFVQKSLSLLDSREDTASLDRLSHGDSTILIESGESANLAVIISGRENEFLINDMRETLAKTHKFCGNALRDWDGDDESVHGVDRLLERLITAGKYDGVYHGSDNPSARRNLLFENVCLGLTRQAQTSPILLCIEDLQWADPSTLALIHYVAREAPKCSILIAGTYRPEDLATRTGETHQFVKAMEMMEREELYEKMELDRLKEKETANLLTSLLGQSDIRKELKRHVHQETEGNPLFVLELAELLVEEGILGFEAGTWKQVRDLGQVDIPSKVYEVIIRRLNRLDEDLREALDMGSINGEEFTFDLLASVLGWDRMRLLRSLRSLERNYRLIRSTNGNYRFDHVKIKEVLYGEMPPEMRMECHEKIAKAIQIQNMDNLDIVAGDLAFHYFRCRKREKALPYLNRAAEIAKKQYANEEAIRFYEEALELEQNVRKRIDLLCDIADVYELVSELENSLESYENALKLEEDKYKIAEIRGKIGWIHKARGDYEESKAECTQALDLVQGEGCREEATALNMLGIVHHYLGDFEKGLFYYSESLKISENLGDAVSIANTVNNVGTIYSDQGDYKSALECFEKRLAICEEIGDLRGYAMGIGNIGIVHRDRGDYGSALECLTKSIEMYEQIGDRMSIAHELGNCGEIYYRQGDFHRALDFSMKALDLSERISSNYLIACSLLNIGNLHAAQEDWDEALDVYKRCLDLWEEIGYTWNLASVLNNIGTVHRELEEYEKAFEFYDRSLVLSKEMGESLLLPELYYNIAEVHLNKGNLHKALELCDKAFSLSTEVGQKPLVVASRRILGMIYRERELWNESTENFENSIQVCREIGDEFGEALSHYEFGLMWKASGDKAMAKRNLTAAIRLFETMKLDKKLKRARDAYGSVANEQSPEVCRSV